MGRRSRLPVGRGQCQWRARAGLLSGRQGGQSLGACRRADGVVDQDVLRPRVPVSLSAGDVRRGARRRNGVPDVRHGALR